jgi:hypothetical protein
MNPSITWPLKKGDKVVIWNVDLEWLNRERARIDKDVYAARYEAVPAPNRYLVFPSYTIREFVDDRVAKFEPDLPVYLAVDPGGTYAVGAIQLKRIEKTKNENSLTKGLHVCLIDTVYIQKTITTSEVFEACKGRPWFPNLARNNDWWDPYQGAIDVSAKEQQRIWSQLGRKDPRLGHLNLHSKKVNIDPGIKTLQHYLDTNTIWINSKCVEWNVEMRRYHYQPASIANQDTQDPRKADKPTDEWNHIIKAVIYFLVGKFGYYGHAGSLAVYKEDLETSIARAREEERKWLN